MLALLRILVVLAIVALAGLAGAAGIFASLEHSLMDKRYAAADRAPGGKVLLVEIDAESLARIGVWPWPRAIHARALDRLMADGADEVAFDVDFSAASTPEADAAFADALAAAGGYAYLAAFEQYSTAAEKFVTALPIPLFRAQAEAVAVNVLRDARGLTSRIPTFLAAPDGPVPALALALGRPQAAPPDPMPIDFGIDLNRIDRVGLADLIEGKVDPALVAGRKVVIGATAIELRDQFEAPRFGWISGPLLQVAALETVLAGRMIADLGVRPALLAAALFGLVAALWMQRLSLLARVALTLIAMILAEVLATHAYIRLGWLMETAPFHIALAALAAAGIADEARQQWQQRLKAQRRLAYLARHDEATDALTRLGLIDDLTEWQSEGRPYALLAVGLQRLRLARGALGQDVTERALRGAADRLRAQFGTALLARLGPDEFVLALPGHPGPDALETARAAIARLLAPGLSVDHHQVLIDAHYGAAASSHEPADVTLGHAELALSAADGSAGRHLVAFAPDMQAGIVARRRLDLDLRQAIGLRQIGLAYQPQVALDDLSLVGVEALVRWTHPELGAVSPADFVPLAEETGFVIELGAYVLAEACREVLAWPWQGRLAVNVSPTQLALSDMAETVRLALAETGFPAHRLDIEVTESLLLDAPEKVAAMLHALKALGCGIAIDDFGTGYSSLSYLADLPFDKLKIDQSFVRRMDAGPANRAILNSVVRLGRDIGKTVVAEGVETVAQRDALKALGCDIGQGYLFGRPSPGRAVAEAIAAHSLAPLTG